VKRIAEILGVARSNFIERSSWRARQAWSADPRFPSAGECAVAVQAVTAERNHGVPQDRRM
jgi:hypothetical protein